MKLIPVSGLGAKGPACFLRISDNAVLVRDTEAKTVLPAFDDARHLDAWQAAFVPAHVTLEGPVVL